MYYLIRVPEKVFIGFLFFHFLLIVSFFVYMLNYYVSSGLGGRSIVGGK